MKKRTIASALIVCSLLAATACSSRPKATVVQTYETFATTNESSGSEETEPPVTTGDPMESIMLRGTGDDEYSFTYDSDIVTYTGQGGNFFLVGSSPTECYLHVMVQSGDTTYDEALETESGRIDEEFVLDSGRRAFCYKTSDVSTCHVIIDASDINPSGNALIKITIGSVDSWLYTYKDLANMVDKGF